MALNLKTPATTATIKIDQNKIEDVESFRLLGVRQLCVIATNSLHYFFIYLV